MGEIKPIERIKGSISVESTLSGKILSDSSLSGSVSVPTFGAQEVYYGEYEIIPDVNGSQTLATAKKYLTDDIIIKEVPYSETTNISNGLTVYIGKDVLTNV